MSTAMMSTESAALLLHEVKSAIDQGEALCIYGTNFGKMARTIFDAIKVLCETVIARESEVNALRTENARIATQRDAALAERDEARTILEGRTTPPTLREIAAHPGEWLVDGSVVGLYFADDRDTSLRLRTNNTALGDSAARAWLAESASECRRWVAIDAEGRPCAWPKVPR